MPSYPQTKHTKVNKMFEFPTVCRLCTSTANLIYDLDDNNPSLVEKLTALAPDTIEFNAILPQKICQSCYDKLNESYSFQQQILLAHKLYKSFMEYQENLENAQGDNVTVVKTEPFEYVEEDFISEDLRHFINNLGNCTAQVNETFIRCRNNNLPEVKINSKRNAARKPPETVVKRKRGRPRKYCGLLGLKNDELTDVQKMKNVVVNSLPNIDPDYEPPRYLQQQPVTINLRKKRGRPRSSTSREEKEAKRRLNETYIITEEIQQVYEVPVIDAIEAGPSTTQEQQEEQDQQEQQQAIEHVLEQQPPDPEPPEGKNKKVTRIGAIQSDVDPHEYFYTLPYDPKVTVNYISNSKEKFFFCKTCNKQYHHFSSLRKHFVTHSSIKIFQCNLCNYETFTKHCLDAHQITHQQSSEPSETCPECGKSFKTKDRLHRHSYCHKKRFICDYCGKKFSHNAMLKKHVQHIHINKRTFFCSVCEYAAKSQEYLNRHMVRHDKSDENKIECTICQKLLKSRHSFKVHMRRHRDERKFQCTLCDKSYVVKSQLDLHFRIHTGYKPFACTFCGKQFRKADYFKNHLRIHTNERPFACHVCSKTFTQKVSLQVHLRLHTGERPFSCDDCGKTFIQSSVYKLHVKRYHPDPVITGETLT